MSKKSKGLNMMEEVRIALNLYQKGAILGDTFCYFIESFCRVSEGKVANRFYREEDGTLYVNWEDIGKTV